MTAGQCSRLTPAPGRGLSLGAYAPRRTPARHTPVVDCAARESGRCGAVRCLFAIRAVGASGLPVSQCFRTGLVKECASGGQADVQAAVLVRMDEQEGSSTEPRRTSGSDHAPPGAWRYVPSQLDGPQPVLASALTRLVAFISDLVIFSVALGALVAAEMFIIGSSSDGSELLAFAVLLFSYSPISTAWWGGTPGKLIFGIRVVRVRDGRPPLLLAGAGSPHVSHGDAVRALPEHHQQCVMRVGQTVETVLSRQDRRQRGCGATEALRPEGLTSLAQDRPSRMRAQLANNRSAQAWHDCASPPSNRRGVVGFVVDDVPSDAAVIVSRLRAALARRAGLLAQIDQFDAEIQDRIVEELRKDLDVG